MTTSSPESEPSGWPRSLEELKESARLWNVDPLAEAKAELNALCPEPSYIIGSADGYVGYPGLGPELASELREELDDIFDEAEEREKARQRDSQLDACEAIRRVLE